jgi:hypothetical protein
VFGDRAAPVFSWSAIACAISGGTTSLATSEGVVDR